MKNLKKLFPIFIIIILSYFAIKPFFIQGFFPIHDDTQVQRVFEMHKSLSNGMFPVRWVSDLGYGYGYPIFNFYAPLAYYIGALFMFINLDALIATKIMMVLGIILPGIFMYLLARELWGSWGGLISALLYIYAPYHALDIYVRGGVAEFWAYAFMPLAFLGIYKVFIEIANRKTQNSKLQLKSKNLLWISVGACGYAGVILSHNLTAMMVTPFLLLFILVLFTVSKNKTSFVLHTSYFILLALSLSAFYWLPVFAEMKYTNILSQIGGGADYKDHFVCPVQLWDSPWGFGGSTSGCIDGLSFKIGKLHILFFLASSIGLLFLAKKEKIKFWFGIFSAFSIFIAIFLMLNQSKFIWDTITQMAFLQYPWRFLVIVTFFMSLMGGAVVWLFTNLKLHRVYWLIIIGIISSIIYFNLELFKPQTIHNKIARDYTNDYHLKWITSRISDEYMPQGFYKPKNYNEIPENVIPETKDVKIISQSKKTQQIRAKVLANKSSEVLFNLAYFPAWHIYINGMESGYSYSNRGLVVKIPQGEHEISLKFRQTPVEKIANMLSLSGVFMLILGIIIFQDRGQKHEQKIT